MNTAREDAKEQIPAVAEKLLKKCNKKAGDKIVLLWSYGGVTINDLKDIKKDDALDLLADATTVLYFFDLLEQFVVDKTGTEKEAIIKIQKELESALKKVPFGFFCDEK